MLLSRANWNPNLITLTLYSHQLTSLNNRITSAVISSDIDSLQKCDGQNAAEDLLKELRELNRVASLPQGRLGASSGDVYH
jgi:hypothetical protein